MICIFVAATLVFSGIFEVHLWPKRSVLERHTLQEHHMCVCVC